MNRTTVLAVAAASLLALAAAPVSPSAAGDAEPARLTHRAHEKWSFVLPAEVWHPVGDDLRLPGGRVYAIEKVGPQKLEVDTDGDGKLDAEVKGMDGFLTLRVRGDKSGPKYSVRLRNTGAKKWEWATGSSRTGKVDGNLVHVFDQNGNGRYDDYGVDAIAVGKDKSGSLLSRVALLKGELHHFEITPDGSSVSTRPFEGPTGLLNAVAGFEGKGKMTSAVFRKGDVAFQVAGDRKGVRVPVGTYEFVAGRIEKGSASVSMRRGRMADVMVTEDGESRVAWGAEVEGEFSFSQSGDTVQVQPNFAFFGKAGEEYYDFAPKGKGPRIVLKDRRTGREIKEARFPES